MMMKTTKTMATGGNDDNNGDGDGVTGNGATGGNDDDNGDG